MNELQTQGKGNLPTAPMPQSGDPIIRSDMIVPYIVIGQSTSDPVVERKVQLGDIYRSTNLEKLGGPDSAVEAVFLHNPKTNWIIEEKPKGATRFEYRRTEPRTASNETLPWSFWSDGSSEVAFKDAQGAAVACPPGFTEWRRVKQFSVFAVLPADIEAAEKEMAKIDQGELPDPTKALTPVVFSFRSTSYYAGREVATFFTQAQSMRVPIHKYKLALTCKLEKNDQGTFYVWVVDRTKAKAVPKTQIAMVDEWASIVNQGAVNLQVHEEGEKHQSEAPVGEPIVVNPDAKSEVC